LTNHRVRTDSVIVPSRTRTKRTFHNRNLRQTSTSSILNGFTQRHTEVNSSSRLPPLQHSMYNLYTISRCAKNSEIGDYGR